MLVKAGNERLQRSPPLRRFNRDQVPAREDKYAFENGLNRRLAQTRPVWQLKHDLCRK